MTFILLTPIALFLATGLFFLAARLFVRLHPANANWPMLWSSVLFAAILIPIAGAGLAVFVPQQVIGLVEGLSFHAALPAAAPRLDGLGAALGNTVPGLDWQLAARLGLGVYLLGVLARLLKLAIGRRRVRQSALNAAPTAPLNGIAAFASQATHTPFVWTPFGRPSKSRVVFPAEYLRTFGASELRQVAQHESQHVLFRDDECGLALRVALCLLWISPFAHAAFGRWMQACEVRCDAAVLNGTSHEIRSDYAQTLLKALRLTANRVRQYPAASFSTPRLRNEKMRITHIMAGTEPVIKRASERFALWGAVATLSLAGGLGFANIANADPASSASSNAGVVTIGDMVTGRLTAPFGKTYDPFRDGTPRVHRGIDIAAPTGTEIKAPADAFIVEATDLYDGKPGYGKVVILETASGTHTMLSHLNDYSVATGQRVSKGDVIAEIGSTGQSTGPHVHIETYIDGERVDPATVWAVAG